MKHFHQSATIAITLFALWSVSCRSSRINKEAYELPPLEVNGNEEEEVIAGEEEEMIYQASADRHFRLIYTELDVSFNLQRREMDGKALIRLTPFFYPQSVLELDAKYFIFNKVELYRLKNGKGSLVTDKPEWRYDSLKLIVSLPGNWQRGDTLQLLLDYVARPEQVKSSRDSDSPISDRKGLYFINPDGTEPNKPTQIWTQGEPTSSSCWFPTIDEPNQRHSQKISMTVPNRWATLSNGTFKGSKKVNDSLRTDIWEQTLPHAPYLTMMAAGEFAIVKDTWRKLPVWYYVEPEYERYAAMVFGKTPKMLELYSNLLGVDYPWDKYHQIVVRDFVSGAMENTGAVIHYDALQHDARRHLDETNEDIIAHELFHHWFGDLVTCESWGQLPLNESFATYGEYLWFEHEHGRYEADNHHAEDGRKYRDENSYKQEKMIRTDYNSPMDMFDNHSYAKGGLILHMLRKTVGDEAFFAGLSKYLKDNAYKSVEMANLRLAMEEVCGLDLSRFFKQWFYREGHPNLIVEHNWDTESRQYRLITRQEYNFGDMPYWIPLDVDFYLQGVKKERQRITLSKNTDTFYFSFQDWIPDAVSFDAERCVLADIKEEKPADMWLNQIRNGTLLQDYLTAFQHLEEDNSELLRLELPSLLNHPFWAVREAAVMYLQKLGAQENQAAMVAAEITKMAMHDPKAKVRLAALTYLQETENADLEMVKMLCNDSSYRVAGRALVILAESEPTAATPLLAKAKMVKDLEYRFNVGEAIALTKTGEDHIEFYNQLFNDCPEYAKFEALGLIAAYGENTKGETRKKLIEMLEKNQKSNKEGLMGFYFYAIIRGLKKEN